jgi:hypothetical protein
MTIPTDGRFRLKFGPFAGLTIAEAYKVKTPKARELGYRHGDGRAYVYWLASEQNPNDYTRDRAAAYFVGINTDAWIHTHERLAAKARKAAPAS